MKRLRADYGRTEEQKSEIGKNHPARLEEMTSCRYAKPIETSTNKSNTQPRRLLQKNTCERMGCSKEVRGSESRSVFECFLKLQPH